MSTEKTTTTTTATPDADVPPFDPDDDPNRESVRPGVETRGPTDPITKHLWRFKRPQRSALVLPFVGHEVKVERWYGRVAANGDETYHGTVLAVATTTTGTTADFLILKTVAGQVWAISTAQIAYIELDKPAKPVRAARKTAVKAEVQATPAAAKVEPTPRATRGRRKAKEVSDAAA